jgi:hypothetical protein
MVLIPDGEPLKEPLHLHIVARLYPERTHPGRARGVESGMPLAT